MNLSGQSVRTIADFYKTAPENILVIHDDMDIGLGKYKIAADSSSAGHNGVQNVIDALGTQKFKRIRVGISKDTAKNPACRLGAHDYVLGKLTDDEQEAIERITPEILKKAEEISK